MEIFIYFAGAVGGYLMASNRGKSSLEAVLTGMIWPMYLGAMAVEWAIDSDKETTT